MWAKLKKSDCSSIRIDGNAEEIWKHAVTISLNYSHGDDSRLAISDATVKLLYDGDFIYLFVEVMDTKKSLNSDENAHRNDAVGVILDFENSKSTSQSYPSNCDYIGYINLLTIIDQTGKKAWTRGYFEDEL